MHSPEEHDVSGTTLEGALTWCLDWLMAPELGIGPFFAERPPLRLHCSITCTNAVITGRAIMRGIVPRVALSLGLGLSLVAGAMAVTTSAAAQGCDPSYPELCLAAYPDLDCIDIGYTITVLHDPAIGAYDPHGFDADYDGIGCESS
jgi:hypothetical protein